MQFYDPALFTTILVGRQVKKLQRLQQQQACIVLLVVAAAAAAATPSIKSANLKHCQGTLAQLQTKERNENEKRI